MASIISQEREKKIWGCGPLIWLWDLVDLWDTPLLNEHGWDNKKTNSFTGRHMGDDRSPHHRTRQIISHDWG